MNNKPTMSIRTDVKRDDQFFNWDHSALNPTSRSDFEFHVSRWVESNNPGVQAACTLKRSPAPHVYVLDIVVLTEQSSLFCSVVGRMDLSFIVVNGTAITEGYVGFIMKLDGADLSRLDEITI
jgi:hypothetical protein